MVNTQPEQIMEDKNRLGSMMNVGSPSFLGMVFDTVGDCLKNLSKMNLQLKIYHIIQGNKTHDEDISLAEIFSMSRKLRKKVEELDHILLDVFSKKIPGVAANEVSRNSIASNINTDLRNSAILERNLIEEDKLNVAHFEVISFSESFTSLQNRSSQSDQRVPLGIKNFVERSDDINENESKLKHGNISARLTGVDELASKAISTRESTVSKGKQLLTNEAVTATTRIPSLNKRTAEVASSIPLVKKSPNGGGAIAKTEQHSNGASATDDLRTSKDSATAKRKQLPSVKCATLIPHSKRLDVRSVLPTMRSIDYDSDSFWEVKPSYVQSTALELNKTTKEAIKTENRTSPCDSSAVKKKSLPTDKNVSLIPRKRIHVSLDSSTNAHSLCVKPAAIRNIIAQDQLSKGACAVENVPTSTDSATAKRKQVPFDNCETLLSPPSKRLAVPSALPTLKSISSNSDGFWQVKPSDVRSTALVDDHKNKGRIKEERERTEKLIASQVPTLSPEKETWTKGPTLTTDIAISDSVTHNPTTISSLSKSIPDWRQGNVPVNRQIDPDENSMAKGVVQKSSPRAVLMGIPPYVTRTKLWTEVGKFGAVKSLEFLQEMRSGFKDRIADVHFGNWEAFRRAIEQKEIFMGNCCIPILSYSDFQTAKLELNQSKEEGGNAKTKIYYKNRPRAVFEDHRHFARDNSRDSAFDRLTFVLAQVFPRTNKDYLISCLDTVEFRWKINAHRTNYWRVILNVLQEKRRRSVVTAEHFCILCDEPYPKEKTVVALCRHRFHTFCLSAWVMYIIKCPSCQFAIVWRRN